MLLWWGGRAEGEKSPGVRFQTSDRCFACHTGLLTKEGRDVSIGFDWRASIMANSSRDPYWQASVRRELIDHPESQAAIEDECSVCHMPVTRYEAKVRGRLGEVFSHLPFDAGSRQGHEASEGVTCSICHQIANEKLGTRESFNGAFVIHAPAQDGAHHEYGPFAIQAGQQRIMETSSDGFRPTEGAHIRSAELCATCHTLYTKALGPGGKVIGELPEQTPYQEWLHSDYRNKQSCQECHMPAEEEAVPIASVLGVPRQGMHRHVFVGGNFFLLKLLNRYRGELAVEALPRELDEAAEATIAFLQGRSARVAIERAAVASGRLEAEVRVENLGGHKLPTAYPSRRAWLHVAVRDRAGRTVFESGALRSDGFIEGNDNDADPARLEPHYEQIERADQVQIYESILGDPTGRVTTALLTGVGYLKDNRLLPRGFDKRTAGKDIAVRGGANEDPDFEGAGDRVRYSIALGDAAGPFEVEAELWYQPIGYRWAQNLRPYGHAAEPRRFNDSYAAMGPATAVRMAGSRMRVGDAGR
jgi:hypothetical protein